MKRKFTTVTRVFRLFADIFDLSAIFRKLGNKFKLDIIFDDFKTLCVTCNFMCIDYVFFAFYQITIKTVLQYFLTDKNVEIFSTFSFCYNSFSIERNGASG